jgi:nitroreductase
MKTLAAVTLALTALTSCGQTQPAAKPDEAKLTTIKLEQPKLDKGIPVMQALSKRHSTRTITESKLSPQQLSEILWAADGVNRPDNHRTSPSAMARYPVDIYAVLPEGVYLYEPIKHDLVPVVAGDFRKQAGRQDFVYIAPLNLVYVADLDRFKLGAQPTNLPEDTMLQWAAIEAGCQAQNVYLYCASEGLGTVIRGTIDSAAFGKVINARPSQRVLCAQTVGHPK